MDDINVNQNGDAEQGTQGNSTRPDVIPVVEEHLHIGTGIVETGRIKVSKKVIVEPYEANVSLFREEVSVEKKALNQYIDGDVPEIRQEGSTTIIPVIKEVIVKRLMLIEEIYITRHTTEHTVAVHEHLRKTEVSVERQDESGHPNESTKSTNNL
jgi:uncharacterized protein (TIGR02271 family)